jgi:ubiquinone biosynthesis monooxygenase Coq7
VSLDPIILEFDKAIRAVFAVAPTVRPVPGEKLAEATLSAAERKHVASLMRVNHCGEICAQALYQGQALTSHSENIRDSLAQAGREETEHLAWTERRIAEMGGRKSLLNPLWYGFAFAIGAVAGRCGDQWNLGFLAETERQVESHLDGHLIRLPSQDRKSWEILEQMKLDEVSHAKMAERLGARQLPTAVKVTMRIAARVMTRTAYYI